MKTSDALRRWAAAYDRAASTEDHRRLMVDLGADADLARASDLEVIRTAAERDRLYSLLTPTDKATADRIAKETTP